MGLDEVIKLLRKCHLFYCRSFDVYGFCHSQHDSLQGDDDALRIKVRKNELDAHRVLEVSSPMYLINCLLGPSGMNINSCTWCMHI